jgi:hypothetical protein
MKRLREENGIVLVLAMMLLLILGLLGMSAINTTSYDNRIAGNKKTSEQAFYVAEAGIQELLGRFREGAVGEVQDTEPLNPDWRRFIALNLERAGRTGYASSNSNHLFLQSLQNRLDFTVDLRHKVNIANEVVTKMGHPVYLMTSLGIAPEGGQKRIEVELDLCPSLDPSAALYSERPVDLNGSSTYIQGTDACGAKSVPGIATTLPQGPTDPVSISGSPTVLGTPSIQYGTSDRSLRDMVDYLRKDANFSYAYGANQTLTGYSNQWGVPSGSGTTTPLSYSGPLNIVYFNMNGNKTLKLAGGSHGAGILLVDGNLELNGEFLWYGLIIVTGALDFTGGGEKNVTGGVMAGESATIQVDVGGNAGIIYCSTIQNQVKDRVTPLRVVRWRDVF